MFLHFNLLKIRLKLSYFSTIKNVSSTKKIRVLQNHCGKKNNGLILS